jgi:hypothetical protein
VTSQSSSFRLRKTLGPCPDGRANPSAPPAASRRRAGLGKVEKDISVLNTTMAPSGVLFSLACLALASGCQTGGAAAEPGPGVGVDADSETPGGRGLDAAEPGPDGAERGA